MASASVGRARGPKVGATLLACVAEHGSAAHPYVTAEALLKGPHAARNLADAVHFLCTLHGRHPGVVDHASNHHVDNPARTWFAASTAVFAAERSFLAKLAVAAGPLPSTPGAGDNDAAVRSQRHAIEMLAQSERKGCALGAALALAADWSTVRLVLDAAAKRFGIDSYPYGLEALPAAKLADEVAVTAGIERALLFGAEQIALQHRALWDLLEARAEARGDE